MATTKLTGILIKTGSIPTTALGGGVISSSTSFATTGSNSFTGNQNINGTLYLTGSLIPSGNFLYDLGSETNSFRDLFISTGSIRFHNPDGTEQGRITVDARSGDISLLKTAGLTNEQKATIRQGNINPDFLTAVSASNLFVQTKIVMPIGGTVNGINLTAFSSSVASTLSNQSAATSSYAINSTIQGQLAGVVSSSAQVAPFLPANTVSSSNQVDITATTGYSTFSSSLATVDSTQQISLTALNAATSSYAINATIQSQLAGVVSSSTQVKPLLPGGTVSASGQVLLNTVSGTTFSNTAFYFPLDVRVDGTLTAQQINTEYVSSSVIFESGSTKFGDTTDDVMSVTGSIRVLGGSISGSMVGMFSASSQVDYNSITNKLSGVVSSSAQVQPLLPGGTVSSSAQVITGVAAQTITPSIINATGAISGASIQTSGNGILLGNVGIGTASPAAGYRTTTAGSSAWITAGANFTIEPDVSSGANGVDLKTSFTAGGNGPLKFWTGATERARLDTSGNLGLGVTPSAYALGKAFEIGNGGNAVWGVQATDLRLVCNTRYDGSNYLYVTNGIASRYDVSNAGNGGHAWFTAPSGTAGNAITFTQAMTLNASGNLGVGTASPATRLDVQQTNAKSATGVWHIQTFDATSATTGVGGGISFSGYKTTTSALEVFAAIDGYKENSTGGNAAGALRFHTQVSSGAGLVERARIDTSGNLGIGTTNPSASLHVSGTMMIQGVIERVNVTGSAPPSTLNVDAISGSVFYLSGSSANNWTINFRGSAATSLNSIMYPGQSMTFAVLVNHASVGYTASVHQIDGASITPRWQGGTLPSGSGTSTDIYSYTLIKTANAAFNIFAAQTKFA
jgi:hypothetical protein